MTTPYDIKLLKDRSMFPIFVREHVRYRDLDTNGHVNSAVFVTYLEQARGRARRSIGGRPAETNSVVGRQLINYFQELKYPGKLDIGTAIVHITRSTWTWGNAVFKGDVCHATGEVTMVLIDRTTKRAAEIPHEFRERLEKLRLRKTENPLILTEEP